MNRRIVCFGDSNTWGYNAEEMTRFPDHVRWPKLLESKLSDIEVVEEGLSGRTAVKDDPLFEGMNAYNYIQPCLLSHAPVELVIMMLGTNDTKERFGLTSRNIAQGITRLAEKARDTLAGMYEQQPQILVVVPPAIKPAYRQVPGVGDAMGTDCDKKSADLGEHLQELLEIAQIDCLDASGSVTMNDVDYMHLNAQGHADLAALIQRKVYELL